MGEEMISIQTADFGGNRTQCVSAKALYEFLELNKKHYAKWIDKAIVKNEYAIEGEDYILGGPPEWESREMKIHHSDVMLTIDFAKKIAMKSNSKKGEEVRQYFINIERSYKQIVEKPQVPMTYIEALEAHLDSQKKLAAQGVQLEQAHKTIDKLTHVGKLYTATEIAKELGMKSATQLNAEIEKAGLQYKLNGTWVLRSWLADKGYTSIKQMELENGKVIYDRKWTQAGREFLLGKFTEQTKSIESKPDSLTNQ